MSTQIRPEQSQSNNSQENSDQTTQQDSQQDQAQTTTQPPAPSTTKPTDVSDLNLLAFRTAERERQRLEEENRQLLARLAGERKTEDFSSYNDRFLTEPATATADITRKIVQEEIRSAFAPLQQDFQRMSRATAYQALKDQVRQAYPDFARIESAVDQIMANQEPTLPNLQVAIPLAIGQLAMAGQWNTNSTAAPANNNPPNNTAAPIPAQLPPSPPAPPRPVNQNQSRPLSELEKRVARENGMTEEDYIKWRDMDEKSVATAQIGIPQQAK